MTTNRAAEHLTEDMAYARAYDRVRRNETVNDKTVDVYIPIHTVNQAFADDHTIRSVVGDMARCTGAGMPSYLPGTDRAYRDMEFETDAESADAVAQRILDAGPDGTVVTVRDTPQR
jgi:hypothetical protein